MELYQISPKDKSMPYLGFCYVYVGSFVLRNIFLWRQKNNKLLKNKYIDVTLALLCSINLSAHQNEKIYKQYEKLSIRRIQHEKKAENIQKDFEESKANMKYWTNSQFWH